MTAAYYGSYFTNNVDSMTWDNAFNPGTSATMSSAPSNEFNQFTLKGGYNFSPTTKLVMGASYGRNTQNESFLNDPTDVPLGIPVSSLNGLVETTQFNARFSAKPMKDLNVNVGYKYLDRDNKTPVNIYEFYDAGEAKTGTSAFNSTLIDSAWRPRERARQQHQHLREPAVQQEAEHVQRRCRVRHRAGPVAEGRVRVPADRPELPGLVDRLRRRDQGDAEHAARRLGRDHGRDGERTPELCVFAAPRRLQPERLARAGADGQLHSGGRRDDRASTTS